MERKKIYNLIGLFIAIFFCTLAILNQFNIIALHNIFNWISYVIAAVALIISLLNKVKFKQRITCLIISVITLILSLITHFTIRNYPGIYSFKIIDDGIEITDYRYKLRDKFYNRHETELVIPSKIMGKEVKVIGKKAFYGHEFDSVIIPDTVEIIESYAFTGARIKTLTLSNNVKIIGESAFLYCELNDLILPNSLEEIGDYAFSFNSWNYTVDHINVPKSVKKIGHSVFDYIEVICLEGDSVINTGKLPFYHAGNLVYYESIAYKFDNIVYALHKDKTATIAYVNKDNKNFKILENLTYNNEVYTITSIGRESCSNIKVEELIIPSSIKTIGYMAFRNNQELKNIYIPSSVTEMGNYVFFNCQNVTITIENLENLSKWSEGWNNVDYNNKKLDYINQSGE